MIRFHWSLWNASRESCFLLSHSIATFRRFWGTSARYIIFTESRDILASNLLIDAEIYEYSEFEKSVFDIDALSTWKKWVPRSRFDNNSVEIHLDIDIFLLREPTEIADFISSQKSFLCLLENFKETWPYGNFGYKLPVSFVPINAGFFGQNVSADISDNLDQAFEWWHANIYKSSEKYHDEQGALLWALLSHIEQGNVQFLPIERYRNISPFDPPVKDIRKLCLIHTTCENHPGFKKYINSIKKISGLPGKM